MPEQSPQQRKGRSPRTPKSKGPVEEQPSTAIAESSPQASPAKGKKRAAAAVEAPSVPAAAVDAGNGAQTSPTPKKRAPAKRKAAAEAAAAAEPAAAAAADAADAPAVAETEAAPAKSPRKRKPAAPKAPPGPIYTTSMRPPPCTEPCTRILSWNVAGMRALLKKDPEALKRLVEQEQVDVLCLQEHKLQSSHVEAVTQEAGLPGWHVTWSCSQDKKGYSGTAVLCRQPPLRAHVGINQPDHDGEGRVVTVELPNIYVVNCYVPNSGEGLKRLDYRVGSWDKALAAYISELQATKPVVLTGDLNTAHKEIDIHDPKRNLRSAGFTIEERESFSAGLLGEVGLVDTFRQQHRDAVGYTYYSYRFNLRAKGKGWRLDYFLVSQQVADKVHDSFILTDVTGSDHLPLGLVLKD